PCQRETYIKQILVDLSFLRLFLQIDIANRVHDQDLAILRHNPLLGTPRPRDHLSLLRRADARRARSLGRLCALIALAVLLCHLALLAAVHLDCSTVLVNSLRWGWRRRSDRTTL